jgi:F420-non-reducing hydrogenase iron-sulfur subunit
MCSGRVDPQFILSAFVKGADGVIILGCHPGDCHYKEGNCRALQRHSMLNLMLEQLGVEKERCRLDYVSAGEGEKFTRVIREMVESTRLLGPLGYIPPASSQDSCCDVLPDLPHTDIP